MTHYTKEQKILIGALVGVVRGAESNPKVNEETYRLLLQGLRLLACGEESRAAQPEARAAADSQASCGETEADRKVAAMNGAVSIPSETGEARAAADSQASCVKTAADSQAAAMTDLLHAEKQRLVPDCYECVAPCGRTADYDLEEMALEIPAVLEAKFELICAMAGWAERKAGEPAHTEGELSATSQVAPQTAPQARKAGGFSYEEAQKLLQSLYFIGYLNDADRFRELAAEWQAL